MSEIEMTLNSDSTLELTLASDTSAMDLSVETDPTLEMSPGVVNQIIEAISPTVEMERVDGGVEITITDKNGEHSEVVYDGSASNLIDDTAGDGDTDVTWSADKIYGEFEIQVGNINVLLATI